LEIFQGICSSFPENVTVTDDVLAAGADVIQRWLHFSSLGWTSIRGIPDSELMAV